MFDKELQQKIYRSGVIAVLVIDDAENAVPLAYALLDGGVTAMELTLRTKAAFEALIQIKKHVPEMTPGIGTILTPEQVKSVCEGGATFGVSPGLNPRVIKAAAQNQLPFAPGIATPSDIEAAIELGCQTLKFFPAEPSGGLGYLKSMAAPYNHLGLKYVPLGGLSLTNFGEYIESPLVLAVGGSWIAKRELIKNKDWKTITRNARETADIVSAIRG